MKKKVTVIFVAIIIIIVIIIYNFKIPVTTICVKFSTIEDKLAFKGVFFTQEYIVTKDKTKSNYDDGKKFFRGENILSGRVASEAGILVKHLDGYENKFNKSNIQNVSKDLIDKIVLNPKKLQGIKLINNSVLYIYGYIDSSYKINKYFPLEINVGDAYYPINIVKTYVNKKYKFLLCKSEYDLDYSHLQRGIKGYIIKARYKGIKIPKSIMCKRNNSMGLYINDNGYAKFVRIDNVIVCSDGFILTEDTCQKYNINEYDQIITNTKFIKDGVPVK